ncbi:MAG: thioredoxin [Arenimonas sp.]
MTTADFVFDAALSSFEQDVILKSKEVPILVDFWASWCEPCKALGPILEKLAAEFNGGFLLAKVDVDTEQQLAGYFQVKSIPTVILMKNGQIVDGFPGALPEGQLREFLKHHGVETKEATTEAVEEVTPEVVDPETVVMNLRAAIQADPDKPELKLDLMLALLKPGGFVEAEKILDGLPANLATDDRAIKAKALLAFAAVLKDAPPAAVLEQAIASNPDDCRARHYLGVRCLLEGKSEAGLEQFLEMLKRNKTFEEGLPRKALIDAFRIIDDEDLVGQYRRKMSSLLF